MPFRRSPTLWLGLFGLIFLLWSWVDSMHRLSAVQWRHTISSSELHAETRESLLHHSGKLTLRRFEPVSDEPYTGKLSHAYRLRQHSPAEAWFPPLDHRTDLTAAVLRSHTLTLPHWLLVLAYTTLWIALLLWRRQRLKHLPPPP
jgi:hypothetical protein